MKGFKYLVVSIVLIIFTSLLYTSVIFFLTFENIINLYYVCIILFFIFILYIITRIIFNNKKIIIYKGNLGALMLISMVIVISINSGVISLWALSILENTDSKVNLYDITLKAKSSVNYYYHFNTEAYNNVKIMYGENSKCGMTVVKKYIDSIERDCERVFAPVTLEPLILQLHYDKGEFNKLSEELEEYTGIYFINNLTNENTIGVFVNDGYDDILAINNKANNFKKLLRHEYVHYYFYLFSKCNNIDIASIPIWYSEGIAEYMAEASVKFNGALPSTVIPFRKISTKEGWINYFNKGYNVYNQGYFAIYNLVLLKGEQVIKNILLKVPEMGFQSAFKEEVGVNLEEFEELLLKQGKDNQDDYSNVVKTQMMSIPQFNETRMLALENYLKENPKCISAYMDLGVMYERNKKYNEALHCLERAADLNPYDGMVWNSIGLASLMIGDYEKGEIAFKKVIELDPYNSSAYNKLAEILLLSDIDEAVKILEEAAKFDRSKELKDILKSYKQLQIGIEVGDPLKEYLIFLSGNSISLDSRKLEIIDKVLEEYYDIDNIYKYEIIKLREKLQGIN